MLALTSRRPYHDPSFAFSNTSCPGFEFVLPGDTRGSGSFCHFMCHAAAGMIVFSATFLLSPLTQSALISRGHLSVLRRLEMKPPRKVLNLEEKDIIQAVTSRRKKCDMAAEHGIPASSPSTTLTGKDAISHATSSGNVSIKKT